LIGYSEPIFHRKKANTRLSIHTHQHYSKSSSISHTWDFTATDNVAVWPTIGLTGAFPLDISPIADSVTANDGGYIYSTDEIACPTIGTYL